MDSRKIVLQETAIVAIGVLVCAAAMVGVFVCKLVGLSGPAIFIGALVGVVCAIVFSRIREGGSGWSR